eukprot:1015249-Pyramimonas_sp.AAC.1
MRHIHGHRPESQGMVSPADPTLLRATPASGNSQTTQFCTACSVGARNESLVRLNISPGRR